MEPERESAFPPQISLWLLGLLGILGVASWFRSQSSAPSQQPVEPIKAQDNTDRNRGIGEKERDVPARVVAVAETQDAKAQRERAEKRRQAIQRFRKAGGAWLSLGTFIVVLAYAVIARNQWQEMIKSTNAAKSAADTAAKELELSQRPWVSLTDITVISPLVFDSNGAHSTISYSFINTGHSPALDGVDLFDFMVPFAETPSPVNKRSDLCKAAGMASGRIRTQGIGQFSESWFPGQPQPMTFQISWNIDDIKKAMVDIPKKIFPESANPLPVFFMPTMVVCVAYRSSFTEAQYHTGYILQLVHKKTFKAPHFMKKGEIPAEELQFSYHPFWGVYAD